MKNVALLPMKLNSERVKGKNFKLFNGKPLYQWILNTLLAVKEIDLIVINTDARDILKEHGFVDTDRLLIRERDVNICGDLVSMNRIIDDDINNIIADTYIMTHTTNPLIKPETIRKALSLFEKDKKTKNIDSLFTVNKIQTRFYDEAGKALNHDPGDLIRTQDLKPWFEENSNLYIFSKNSFSKSRGRIGLKPIMHEMNRIESIDIDDDVTWSLAEAVSIYSQMHRNSSDGK